MIGLLASIKSGITTLTGRLTSGRATNLDNLDAAVTTRAPASTALSSATWTGTRAGYLDSIGIKRIQAGTITVTATDGNYTASNTATITSVSTSKAVCLYMGHAAEGSPGLEMVDARVELTNATTVTAKAKFNDSSGSRSVVVGYTVLEFNG